MRASLAARPVAAPDLLGVGGSVRPRTLGRRGRGRSGWAGRRAARPRWCRRRRGAQRRSSAGTASRGDVADDVHIRGGVDLQTAPAGGDDGADAGRSDGLDNDPAAVGGVFAEAHAAEPDVDRRLTGGQELPQLGGGSQAVEAA